mmetsp:Transcript_12793/g.17468  ORF Transcript_12793/g.17468 Transcript_12793/m.17468 type:complete len:394 (+) Transcript_12793:1224-2405(+)
MLGDRILLRDFTYNFRQRDRIGVVGPNGVGKSTFLKVLTGKLALEKGTVRIGETVRIGYYEQTGLVLTAEQENEPVLRFVQQAVDRATMDASTGEQTTLKNKSAAPQMQLVEDKAPMGRRKMLAGKEAAVNVQIQDASPTGGSGSSAFSEREAMSLLTRFQFPSKRWYDRVGQLSGGERRRLQLLQVLATAPNVLLLDEPSNDLDLSTLSALEEYLTEVFDGCLVVVSHDNFFVNRVAEHLFVFEGDGTVSDFQGSYTEYLECRQDLAQLAQARKTSNKQTLDTPVAASTISNTKATTTTTSSNESGGNVSENKGLGGSNSNLSYNEKKEFNKLEKEISKLSAQIQELEEKISNSSSGKKEALSALNEWTQQLIKLKTQLEVKESRWMELAEK